MIDSHGFSIFAKIKTKQGLFTLENSLRKTYLFYVILYIVTYDVFIDIFEGISHNF